MDDDTQKMPMMTEEELMMKSKEELVAMIIKGQAMMAGKGECKDGKCTGGDAPASCKS